MKRFTVLLALFVFLGMALQAQGVQITGNVSSSEDGAPLPGVSVVVKGTTVGTVTDINGKYSISVPSNATTLVFSFVGMRTQEVPISGKTQIDVTLATDALNIDEVVVTAIGVSRQQKALGYSVVDVNTDETIRKSEPDLLKALQGKVPGVDIRSSSGAPGTATRITIRGNSSFTGDNQPLFVVDGIPYSNVMVATTDQNSGGGAYASGISSLDPNNIESMTILKGAAAAALYGSRAMNGVVVITTKTGNPQVSRKGLEVTVNSSVNFETIAHLPEYQNTYGNGANFDYSNANGSWGPRFGSLDSIKIWSPEYQKLGFGDSLAYVAQPNNVKDLFNVGVVYDNSINIAAGSERSALNFTASALNNAGYIPFSSFNRYAASVGGTTQLENGLKVNGSVSYTSSKQVGGLFGNNQSSSEEAASSFARALWLGRTWIMRPYTTVDGGPLQPNGAQFDNPLWSWKHNQVTTNMDRIVANMNLTYDLTNWLNVSYRLGANTLIQGSKQVVDIGSRGYEGVGGIVTDDYNYTELESDLLLTVNHNFGEKLTFTGFIGQSVNQRATARKLFQGKGIMAPGIYDMNNTLAVVPYGGGITKRRIIGLFGDITLGYDDYLFLDVTGRNDWSSTLAPGSNSYFYPAASLSFLLTEAFKGLQSDVFNYGKLRVAWGEVGNDAGPYSIYPAYYMYNTPILGQPSMYVPDTFFSSDLSPEFKGEFEVGTNLVFFNRRVGIDFTYYNNNSTSLITPIQVAPSSGYTLRYLNVGKLNNTGIEIGLNLTPVRTTSGFEWTMYGAFTHNKSEVKAIYGDVDKISIGGLFGDPSIMIAIGQPYGAFYGNYDATDDNGNLLIDKGSGFLIRAKDQKFYGDPNPDFISSLTNTLTFKGLSVSALVEYRQGGDVYSNSVSTMLGRGVTKDTEDREKTVIIPGVYGDPNTATATLDANGNEIQNVTQVTVNDLYFGESFAINAAGYYNVYDATTWRLREVAIGYEFPEKWIQKTPFGSVNFSITGRNLWYYCPNIPKYTHFDPDVNGYGNSNIQGVEYTVAPSVKRIGFNLKLTF